MTSELTYQLRDGVARLTLNRPEARNSLNTAARRFGRGCAVVQRRRRSRGAGADRSRAQRAFQIGFVNRLAKHYDLANTDQALPEPIAANDPLSMTAD